MPGIVGLVTRMPREWAEPQLLRMLKAICHDPSYSSGTWIDESLGVYVGWAARKGSFSDGMPLRNEREDVLLVFSGEEFPEPGTARRLKESGHSLDLAGPSYLVHLYEQDPTFPAGLNGRFHGLLVDHTHGTAKLFNDRYGMHRIYYHESNQAFYFSAEAKAILAVRPELRTLNPRSFGEFISCGCVLENRSLFSGVEVLPPASMWVFRGGSIERKDLYFQARQWEDQGPLEPEEYYRELRDVFSGNLPRYFNGRQPIGLSLTGGLDTRMILAWQKSVPGSLPCYTFRGMYNDCQDVIIARKVAKVCEQPHQEIFVGDNFLSRFPDYAERSVYLTDGCVDVSRSPVLFANEQAAAIAPVRMTGNYGSEILRRLVAFRPGEPPAGLFSAETLLHVREAKKTYASLFQGHPLSFIAFRQVPWHHWGLLALEQSQLSPRSPYLDNDLVRTAFRVPHAALRSGGGIFADNDDCLRLVADGNRELRAIRGDRGVGGPRGPYGLMMRVYLEATFKAEYEYDHGMRQAVARIDHVFSPLHLERLFLGRHKYYHFRIWYRDALSNYVRDMLLDSRTLSRPYVERKALETVVRSHLKGERNYTDSIHRMLTLELLHRLFVD